MYTAQRHKYVIEMGDIQTVQYMRRQWVWLDMWKHGICKSPWAAKCNDRWPSWLEHSVVFLTNIPLRANVLAWLRLEHHIEYCHLCLLIFMFLKSLATYMYLIMYTNECFSWSNYYQEQCIQNVLMYSYYLRSFAPPDFFSSALVFPLINYCPINSLRKLMCRVKSIWSEHKNAYIYSNLHCYHAILIPDLSRFFIFTVHSKAILRRF